MHTLQSSNPGNRGEELPLLPFVAQEILAIPALSAGAKSIFSAMNTIVTKTRHRFKQFYWSIGWILTKIQANLKTNLFFL